MPTRHSVHPLRRFTASAEQLKYPHRLLASAIIAASACLTLLPLSSSAGIIINVSEVGSDVVAVATGSANTSALSFLTNITANASMLPSSAVLLVGTASNTTVSWYNGASGPATLGNGSITNASFGSGDSIGVLGGATILLPTTLSPSLSGNSTWAGTKLAQLGLDAGTYTWTWGAGANADSLTINVSAPSPSPVPEIDPSCLGSVLALLGGGFGLVERRRLAREGGLGRPPH